MKITAVNLTPVFSRRETGSISRNVIVRLGGFHHTQLAMKSSKSKSCGIS